MENRKSKAAALSFMDYVAQKGLMAPATARARKAAVNKIFEILSDEEAQDVIALDLDEVVTRFGHLKGKDYTPESLLTYKSRLKSAIEDFSNYLDNPLAFKPGVQSRERKLPSRRETATAPDSDKGVGDLGSRANAMAVGPMSSSILPIPVRADLTVYVQGLPFDLTSAEARKIANVVMAMAAPESF